MSQSRTSKVSPVLALTIIRQILRGEGDYAHIDGLGDQLEAVGEMVDQALSQVPTPVAQIEVVRDVDARRLACLEALVLEALGRKMYPKEVSGQFDVSMVYSMPECIAAVFAEAEPILTFESELGEPENRATCWVKLNTQPGQRFFQEWDADGWLLVEPIEDMDPTAEG